MNAGTAAELPPYAGIGIAAVHLILTPDAAIAAGNTLLAGDAIGFDTESRPTFNKGESSDGPHLVQLATDTAAYLFPVTDRPAREVLRSILEAPHLLKVGFGLGDDLRRLQGKLGIVTGPVLDLAQALRRDKRADVGAKGAVERFFGQRLHKSRKTSTTNWAHPRLTERQLLYAANDAHVALRIYRCWLRGEGAPPSPR